MNRPENILDAIALDAITKRHAASITSLSKPNPSILHSIFNRPLNWFMVFLLSAVMVGCGGKDPILGGGGAGVPLGTPAGAVVPGACMIAGPKVTSSDPTSGNQFVTTSTTGTANGGKLITATFSVAMDPATINATTFKVAPVGGVALVPASVSYNASTKVATFTTTSALLANTSYTAIITTGATSGGTPLSCSYAWSFKTVTPPAASPAAINLGRASTFGIASRDGMTSTGVTVVNGNVALDPTATCTDATGGPGSSSQSCLVQPVYATTTGLTVNGSIYWAGDPFDSGVTAQGVTTDLTAAWNEGMAKVNTQPAIAADELGGKTFIPGVYENANLTLSAGGVAILDAQNNPDAIFIFKTALGGDLVDSGTLLLPSRINLINQAQAKNVWFVIGRDATIGSGTTWNGNILANRTATVKDNSTVNGRVLAGAGGAGALSLIGAASPSVTTINVP
jgi:hypothetical protein